MWEHEILKVGYVGGIMKKENNTKNRTISRITMALIK